MRKQRSRDMMSLIPVRYRNNHPTLEAATHMIRHFLPKFIAGLVVASLQEQQEQQKLPGLGFWPLKCIVTLCLLKRNSRMSQQVQFCNCTSLLWVGASTTSKLWLREDPIQGHWDGSQELGSAPLSLTSHVSWTLSLCPAEPFCCLICSMRDYTTCPG